MVLEKAVVVRAAVVACNRMTPIRVKRSEE